MAASAASSLRRAAVRGGRKPAKKKRSVGSPESTSAASVAEAPGSVVTGMPASTAARTSLKPGSETSGVPASDTSAMVSPRRSRSSSNGRMRAALCS